MALKQIQLNGGVTRQPDDALSGNGTLSACVNMCSDGAGLQMLEKPTELFTLGTGEMCVYIHQAATFKHFIIYNKTEKKVLWIDADGGGYARNELIGCSCARQEADARCSCTTRRWHRPYSEVTNTESTGAENSWR